MTSYYIETRAGTFWIRADHQRQGQWQLGVGDDALGNHATPMSAADEVTTHSTGWAPWDRRPPAADDPSGLDEWIAGRPE